MSFFTGLAAGLIIAVSLGPSFIYMMQMAIRNGLRASLLVAAGIVVCDLVLMVIAFLGAGKLIVVSQFGQWMGIGGGIMLIAMGTSDLVKWRQPVPSAIQITTRLNPVFLIFKGFILNVSNPFNLFFWIGVAGLAATKLDTSPQAIAFLSGFFVTEVVSTWMKCYLAAQLGSRLNQRHIAGFNHLVGAIFVVAGVYLMLKTMGIIAG